MAIDLEELEPRRKGPQPRNLEPMGVEELQAYVAELQAEIRRVEVEIEVKKKRRSGAESIFKR
jgi:uncharacterized small protein (DUF1192 family)